MFVLHPSAWGTGRHSMLSKTAVGVAPLSLPYVVPSSLLPPSIDGLVGVALLGKNLSLFHSSWAVAGGGVGVFSPLTRGGSEVDLVMVTCTQSRISGLPGVELLNGHACIAKVVCWVPGLIVFWRVTGPLGTVLQAVSVNARVDNFFQFVFWFSLYLNRQRRCLDL